MNFEEEYIDLDHETLENEFIDFKVILYASSLCDLFTESSLLLATAIECP